MTSLPADAGVEDLPLSVSTASPPSAKYSSFLGGSLDLGQTPSCDERSESRKGLMMDENYSGGWGGGASCTKVRARVIFVPNVNFVSSSLRSSSKLTSPKTSRMSCCPSLTPAFSNVEPRSRTTSVASPGFDFGGRVVIGLVE